VSSIPPIRLLPTVVGGNEVVGAVMVGVEDDDDGEDGDENGDGDDVVPEVVVSVAAPPPFCVKSIVRRTGWHISSAEPTTVADAHNSKLLTLPRIVTLIGSIMVASLPRTTVTSMPMFLVERLLLLVAADVVVAVEAVVSLVVGVDGVVAVTVLGGMAVVEVTPPPLSPIFNVNVSELVPSGGVIVLVVVPVLSPPPPVNV